MKTTKKSTKATKRPVHIVMISPGGTRSVDIFAHRSVDGSQYYPQAMDWLGYNQLPVAGRKFATEQEALDWAVARMAARRYWMHQN